MTKRVPSPLPRLLAAGMLASVPVAPGPGESAGAATACNPGANELRVTFQPVDQPGVACDGLSRPRHTLPAARLASCWAPSRGVDSM